MGPNTLQKIILQDSSHSNLTINKSEEIVELLKDTGDLKGIQMNQEQGNYLMLYTCGVCGTRQNRSFTKHAYNKGVVMVRCEGCKSLHLIADNLGFFGDEPGIRFFYLALHLLFMNFWGSSESNLK